MTKYLSLLVYLLSMSVNAALITANTTAITQTAQQHTQQVLLSSGFVHVTLDISVKGDFNSPINERFQLFIDDSLLADWVFGSPGITSTNNYDLYDYSLAGTIKIGRTVWERLSADGILDIRWENGPWVNPFSLGGDDFVAYSMRGYATVPEPLSLLLLALVLFALVYRRFAH